MNNNNNTLTATISLIYSTLSAFDFAPKGFLASLEVLLVGMDSSGLTPWHSSAEPAVGSNKVGW